MKRKIMLGASAGLIGALAIAGAAFAQEGPADGNRGDSIKDRIAEILGIDREDLNSAMHTARDEYRDAMHDEKIAELVAQGVITPEQAEEIEAWKDSRPAAMDELQSFGGGHGRGMMPPVEDSAVEARLAALVEQEVITRDEADEILAWYNAKPEYLDDLRSEMHGERDGQHNGHRGRMGRGRHGGPGQFGPMNHGGFGQFGQQAPESGTGTTFTLPNGSEITF